MSLASPKRFLIAALSVAGLAILLALAVYLRTINYEGLENIPPARVLAWQALSWLPLVLLAFFLEVSPRARAGEGLRAFHPFAHLGLSVVFALVLTFWFKSVSEWTSPYAGFPGTRFGVFPWFFIFWFFIQLLLYWVAITFYGLLPEELARLSGPTFTQGGAPKKIVIKTGKMSEVIDPAEILWVEAQDYYSVLHLKERQAWVKMTMGELEETLNPSQFVRVHRSTILNVNFLARLEQTPGGKYLAILNDGKKRPISRHGWRALKPLLKTSRA
ncbi:MAG TPA: LytTR family DNA-binding domain-containing protein [Sphingomonadales bacterium]|nr:LytTR family DNA-binding domain-containing protein [Sphingomonadales bacterium]